MFEQCTQNKGNKYQYSQLILHIWKIWWKFVQIIIYAIPLIRLISYFWSLMKSTEITIWEYFYWSLYNILGIGMKNII